MNLEITIFYKMHFIHKLRKTFEKFIFFYIILLLFLIAISLLLFYINTINDIKFELSNDPTYIINPHNPGFYKSSIQCGIA